MQQRRAGERAVGEPRDRARERLRLRLAPQREPVEAAGQLCVGDGGELELRGEPLVHGLLPARERDAAEEELVLLPARDPAAVGAVEARPDPPALEAAGDERLGRAAELLGAGGVLRDGRERPVERVASRAQATLRFGSVPPGGRSGA